MRYIPLRSCNKIHSAFILLSMTSYGQHIFAIRRKGGSERLRTILAFGLGIAFVGLLHGIAAAGNIGSRDSIALPMKGYVELKGEDATQFLIGNTLVWHNYSAVISNDYFVTRDLVLEGHQSCRLIAWRDSLECFRTSASEGADCHPFRVFAKILPPAQSPTAGEQIGIYFSNQYGHNLSQSVLDRRWSKPIVRGNATDCPHFAAVKDVKPVEVDAKDSTIPLETKDEKLTGLVQSGRLLKKRLVGNSIYWPMTNGTACEDILYFKRDGQILCSACGRIDPGKPDTTGQAPRVRYEETSHWKMLKGKFCTESNDEGVVSFHCMSPPIVRKFDDSEFPVTQGKMHLHASLAAGPGCLDTLSNPTGIIVSGSAAPVVVPHSLGP